MPTTNATIKLPDGLKERIARAAKETGAKVNEFMPQAIESYTQLIEDRSRAIARALAVEEDVARDGLVYDGDEALAWIGERLAGRLVDPPAKRVLSSLGKSSIARLVFGETAITGLMNEADLVFHLNPDLAATLALLFPCGFDALRRFPLTGRRVDSGLREFLVGGCRHTRVALYRYDPASYTVLVLDV